jgi:hypothetical protein
MYGSLGLIDYDMNAKIDLLQMGFDHLDMLCLIEDLIHTD